MWIKYSPEEFIVREDGIVGHKKDNCTVCTVKRRNWDTTLLTKELCRKLGISQKRIGYAGLKDKASVAYQQMSFSDVTADALESLAIRDVEISGCAKGDCIEIGDLRGNFFDVVVRDIPSDPSEMIDKRMRSFGRWGGFINYYGYQRFGLSRPVTADVGKLLVKKDFENAALTYIAKAYPDDPHKEIRKDIWESRDYKEAYKTFPLSLKYERAMLFELSKGKDFRSCFSVIPDRLLQLFIHAFQSRMFNEIVKRRCEIIEPHIAEEGDIVVTVRNGRRAQMKVTPSNIGRINSMTTSSLSVGAPLIGHRTRFSESLMGRIAMDVLEAEEVSTEDFASRDRPLYSSGSYREILARYSDMSYTAGADEVFGTAKCTFSFFLDKGQYATEFIGQLLGETVPPYRRQQDD